MTPSVALAILFGGTHAPMRIGILPVQLSQFLGDSDALHFVLLEARRLVVMTKQ